MPHRQRFRTGERIPYSGIYRVFHASHRLPHEVTLVDGEEFPRCLKCANAVEFELIQEAPDIRNEGAFRVVLFGLPSTDEILAEPVAINDPHPATEIDSAPDQIAAPEIHSAQAPVAVAAAAAESAPPAGFSQPEAVSGDGLQLTKTKYKTSQKFKPGERVPERGIYNAEHPSHSLFHQVTLGKDTLFPKCRTCGPKVRFRLLRSGTPGSVVAPLSSSILEDSDAPEPPSTKDRCAS